MTKEELFKIKGGDTFSSPVADGINKNFDKLVEAIGEGGGSGYVLPAATKEALGGVKQGVAVASAVGDNVTKAEFEALLTSLKDAGIIAKS